MESTHSHNEYDLEPVSYCPKCYSLKIGYIPGVDDSDYCMECGCLDIVQGNIYDWEKLYEGRYGHKYVTIKKTIDRHPIWNLSVRDLRKKLLQSRCYMEIIREIYPDWRYFGTPVDVVFYFFDNIIKDRMMTRLRKIMIARNEEGML